MEARIGQFLAFGVAIGFAVIGAYVTVQGHSLGAQIGGGIFGSSAVAGLVSAFILGRQHQHQERHEEADE